MWHILRRRAPQCALYFALVAAALITARLLLGDQLDILFAILSGPVLFMFVFLILVVEEQYEEKHHGYAILSVLPLKDSEIVAAKFLFTFVVDAAMLIFLMVLFSTFFATPAQAAVVRGYFLAAAGFALVFAGLLYSGIFAFGYTKFLISVMTIFTALGLVPALILKSHREDLDTWVGRTIDWLGHYNVLALLAVVLTLYSALYVASTFIKRFRSSA